MLTGSTSFSGLHIARALSEPQSETNRVVWSGEAPKPAGFEVQLPVRKRERKPWETARFSELSKLPAELLTYDGVESPTFLKLLESRKPRVLWNHGAFMEDYRSPSYNLQKSFETNLYPLQSVLETFASNGGRLIVHSGSIFEPHEGEGDNVGNGLSAYGVSKSLVYEWLRYQCCRLGLGLLKVVIPNPIGTFENPDRLIPAFVKMWQEGKTPEISAPAFVRDNVPVTWLALHAADAIRNIVDQDLPSREWRIHPSGLTTTTEDFVRLVADQLGRRLEIATPIRIHEKTTDKSAHVEPKNRLVTQPLKRINTEPSHLKLSLDREKSLELFWDELAEYYRSNERAQ